MGDATHPPTNFVCANVDPVHFVGCFFILNLVGQEQILFTKSSFFCNSHTSLSQCSVVTRLGGLEPPVLVLVS